MTYAFYPGCSLQGTAKDYLMSTLAVADALNLDLREIPDWVCCGASPAHQTDKLMGLALPARVINNAARDGAGREVLTVCAACYHRLRIAQYSLKENAELRGQVNQILDEEFQDMPVRHLLDVLVRDMGLDQIKEAVKKPLEGLTAACYYGCLLARPPEVAFDDVENPTFMDKLCRAIGMETVEWGYKTECCGAALAIPRTDIVVRLVGKILRIAKECGAECIVVACPLCHSNLDMRQVEAADALGMELNLPVLYFTQVLGLALGLSPKALGLNKAITDPRPLLRTKGMI